MKLSARSRAARKGARTRAANREMLKRWREVGEPSLRRVDLLINQLLKTRQVSLRWNPLGNKGSKLKRGAEYGTLIGVRNGGRTWRVLADGYKRPHDFHPSFWEVLA